MTTQDMPRMHVTPSGTTCTWKEELSRLVIRNVENKGKFRETSLRRSILENKETVRKILANDQYLIPTVQELLSADTQDIMDQVWSDTMARCELQDKETTRLVGKWGSLELMFSLALTQEIANIKGGLTELQLLSCPPTDRTLGV